MIQRFIELGEGYSDLYELIEIARTNKHRITRLLALHTIKKERNVTSLAIVMEQTNPGDFQAIYICREGIPNPNAQPNKRYDLFHQLANELNQPILPIEVKPSSLFAEKDLYFQYLIGILRINHYIPQMK